MPTNITDTSTFTDPIQGPADADPQNAASYLVGYQGLANRTAYLKDHLDPVEAIVRPDLAASHGAFIPALWCKPVWDASDSRPAWQPADLGAGAMRCWSNDGEIQFAVWGGAGIPFDCTITAIKIWVKPANTGLGESSRLGARYALVGSDFNAGTYVSEVRVADTTDTQAIQWTGLSHRIFYSTVHPGSPNLGLVFRINGSHVSAPVDDLFYAIELQYTVEKL